MLITKEMQVVPNTFVSSIHLTGSPDTGHSTFALQHEPRPEVLPRGTTARVGGSGVVEGLVAGQGGGISVG